MKKLYLLAILLLFPLTAGAQNEANVWFFGDGAGMDFGNGAPRAIFGSRMLSYEGCASLADKNGNLLFYTNGESIWNRSHDTMPNGNKLGGHNSSTQSSLFLPKPGSPNQYYLFTVMQRGDQGGLTYSIVDMSRDKGFGDITTKNTMLFPRICEKISAIQQKNGYDYWLLVHEFGSNAFLAYPVTAAGIGNPVISRTGSVHDSTHTLNALGQMKFSPDGSRLALASYRQRYIDIFDFDINSGQVRNPIHLERDMLLDENYGVEFSPDGLKLYATTLGGELFQFDLTKPNAAEMLDSRYSIKTDGRLGSMQIAPDGKIYIAKDNSEYLDVINEPDKRGADFRYRRNGFYVMFQRKSRLGLPNFLRSYISLRRIFVTRLCFGELTRFSLLDTNGIQRIVWDFGDPPTQGYNLADSLSPVHFYSQTGEFMVSATIYYSDGRSEVLTEKVNIARLPKVAIPDKVTDCTRKDTLIYASAEDNPDYSYLWSTQENTRAIRISKSGKYWVKIFTGNCEAMDSMTVQISDYSIAIKTPEEICQGDTVVLSAGPGAASYQWEPPLGLSSPGNATTKAYPLQTTMYRLKVTAPGGCIYTDSVLVRVTDSIPIHRIGIRDTVLCSGNTLVLRTGKTGWKHRWNTGDSSNYITVSKPGKYFAEMSRKNCFAMSDTVTVHYSDLQTSAALSDEAGAPVSDTSICRGSMIRLAASGGTRYSWGPSSEFSDPSSATVQVSPQDTTTYTVTVSDSNGCSVSKSVRVKVIQPLRLSLSLSDVSVQPGMRFSLTLRMSVPGAALPVRFKKLTLGFAYDDDFFVPSGATRGAVLQSGTNTFSLTFEDLEISQNSQVLTEIRGKAYLGDSSYTGIKLSGASANICVSGEAQDARFSMNNCFINGRPIRLFEPASISLSGQNGQDPALHIRSSETGLHRVAVYDTAGNELQSDEFYGSGDSILEKSFPIRSGLADGIYYAVLYAPGGVSSQILPLIR